MKTITVTRCLHLLCGGLAAWGLSSLANAQDVEIFGVIKNQQFVQESEGIVRLAEYDNEDPLSFECFVDAAEGGTVNSAKVTPPGGAAIDLVADGGSFEFRDAREALQELNASYPDGGYDCVIQTGSGQVSTTLTLSGDTYPNVPRVSNFAAAQAIDTEDESGFTVGFTIVWDAFADGTTDDYIEFAIEDENGEVFHSGPPGPSGLDGMDTSVLIPAGTLESGRTYNARLMFAKIAEMQDLSVMQDLSGPLGVAAYTKTTEFEIRTAGPLADLTAPSLVEMWPRPWNGDVPVRSVIAFRFSEVMAQGSLSLAWSGSGLDSENFTNNFTYQWSGDGKVLYAIYPAGLPADKEISWVLNINDLAGNALPQQSDSFTTSMDAASTKPDVAGAFFVKNQIFMQNGSGVQSSGMFFVELDTPLNHRNAIPSGSITTPAPLSGVAQLDANLDDDDVGYEAVYASKEDMDRFFPSGDYGIVLNTAHDGMKSATLTFPADAYPSTPTVLSALQSLDSTQQLTVSWGDFIGGTNNDVILLEIESENEDLVFESPGPGEFEHLTGESTSVNIPPNTLSPGRTYQAYLIFAKVVDMDVSSGVQMVSVFAKTTLFEMTTSGERIQPKATPVPGSGSFQVLVTGDRHVSYAMEASTNFTNWYEISYPQATGDGTQITLEDWNSSMFKKRFYRVREITDEEFYQRPVAIQGMVVNSQNGQPVAGAVISTTLDGNTATTDADGLFFLQTGVTDATGQTQYSVHVTKSGFQTLDANWYQGNQPRNQWFSLQPQ